MAKNRYLRRIALILLGLLLPVLFFEGCVFRTVLPAAQLPDVVFRNGLPRYQAGQTGIYRVRDEIAATFRINDAGWNSGHATYVPTPAAGRFRIAVIGDSYVEALQVDYDASFAERLEARLGPEAYEVYRFGISGAPLSHYLHMLRQEVVGYRPDLVVVNLVHNDFVESYTDRPGVYNSAFLKLEIEGDKVVGERPPAGYRPPWYAPIRDHSAIWGYFVYRQRLEVGGLRRLILGPAPSGGNGSNGTPTVTAAETNATAYVLAAMQTIAQEHGFTLLLLIDADRDALYRESTESRNLSVNRMVLDQARRLDLPALDLQPIFAAAYAGAGRSFEFKYDNHWNGYAHTVVAGALYDYITKEVK